ncbi:hypothetical protein LRS05_15295 [Flavobacterium sp. J372]|uniref:hypothetical protein n=1 Tax=Flavobacterium sp. J372 TaxID=2898436 RepID=UPI0021507265|nr:hypothetical protein [Flavobacterium sp. J372]MCR5863396.1 hypothetical protein [Flavobacterium sp. J372]
MKNTIYSLVAISLLTISCGKKKTIPAKALQMSSQTKSVLFLKLLLQHRIARELRIPRQLKQTQPLFQQKAL